MRAHRAPPVVLLGNLVASPTPSDHRFSAPDLPIWCNEQDPEDTGLPVTVWVSPRGRARHAARGRQPPPLKLRQARIAVRGTPTIEPPRPQLPQQRPQPRPRRHPRLAQIAPVQRKHRHLKRRQPRPQPGIAAGQPDPVDQHVLRRMGEPPPQLRIVRIATRHTGRAQRHQPVPLGNRQPQPLRQHQRIAIQQRRETQHRIVRRAAPDQPLQSFRRHALRQHRLQHANPPHRRNRRGRVRRRQDTLQLAPHPLGRQQPQPRHPGPNRRQCRRIGLAGAIPRMEPKKPQNPQVILGNPLRRIADEPHAAGVQIGHALEIVEHLAILRHRHRVDGEIPPGRVLAPILSERHHSASAVCLDVAPQRRHLEAPMPGHRRHRAVLNPGRHRLQAGPPQRKRHRLRRLGGGEIDVRDLPPQQRIPHRTANQPRPRQRRQHRRHRRIGQPRRRIDPQRRRLGHGRATGTRMAGDDPPVLDPRRHITLARRRPLRQAVPGRAPRQHSDRRQRQPGRPWRRPRPHHPPHPKQHERHQKQPDLGKPQHQPLPRSRAATCTKIAAVAPQM